MLKLPEQEMRAIRGKKVAYVFQDPMTSLNPVKKVGEHFIELVRTHDPDVGEEEALERAKGALKDVGIPPERVNDYPHQFSGGMRQRIMIALAIGLNPDLVIADEPTTALDVIVQAKILDLLRGLRDRYGMALMLVTHDLSIVLERCDKVIVMYAGNVVEYAGAAELHRNPTHPYTQGLLQSIPNIELEEQSLKAIGGSPPSLLNPPNGCPFWPRCACAGPRCSLDRPSMQEVAPGHFVRCFGEAASLDQNRKS
jgi:peptide/nickel transport system ATP-binding protein